MKKVLLKLSIVIIVVLCVFFVGCKKKENNQPETKLHDMFVYTRLCTRTLTGCQSSYGF